MNKGVEPTCKRAYLSGPMRGYENHNFPAFHQAAKMLREDGFEVDSPAEHFDGVTDHPIEKYLEVDIRAVMDTAIVILLPGWSESVGCNVEVHVAHSIGHAAFAFHVLDTGDYELKVLDIRPPRLPYSSDPVPIDESILAEADLLINGSRRGSYGHPLDDYSKVAGMTNALFASFLKPGVTFRAEHMPMWMELVKLSRELHCPKRDNRVDGCGYWGVIHMIHAERARREQEKQDAS